jgi:hypothetical protein
MQRINALARLLNVLGYGIWKKFVNHILQVRRDDVGGDQLDHLLTDGADLQQKLLD